MKKDIHPDYHEAVYECACGSQFVIGTTKKSDLIKVDVCRNCHPFYTGTQKHIETGGRIDRFKKRLGKVQ